MAHHNVYYALRCSKAVIGAAWHCHYAAAKMSSASGGVIHPTRVHTTTVRCDVIQNAHEGHHATTTTTKQSESYHSTQPLCGVISTHLHKQSERVVSERE